MLFSWQTLRDEDSRKDYDYMLDNPGVIFEILDNACSI